MALSVQTYEASPLNPSVRLWCACVLVLLLGHASSAASEVQVWNFDQDSLSTASAGFHVGTLFDGRPAGDWQVVSSDKATSPPHVLAQLHGKGAEHACKLVLVQGTEAEDIELRSCFCPSLEKLIWEAGSFGERLTIATTTSYEPTRWSRTSVSIEWSTVYDT